MNFKKLDYNSKISRFLTRIMELVLLNFVFILTCIPILTIGASITALYAITLKMVRGEEGYIIRGYFKNFVQNLKQGTAFFVVAAILYFLLYIVYMAAFVNGGVLLTAYTAITLALGLIYSIYFLFLFAFNAVFENTMKEAAFNCLRVLISHFPMVLTGWLTVAAPLFISFGINAVIMQYAVLFWILIGFSGLALWGSVYFNQIFSRYIDGAAGE